MLQIFKTCEKKRTFCDLEEIKNKYHGQITTTAITKVIKKIPYVIVKDVIAKNDWCQRTKR